MADAPKKQKPATRAELEADLDAYRALYDDLEQQLRGSKLALGELAAAAKSEAAELRGRIDTLKTRLADAEFQNARMRGYIERVQEDDVVREELLTVTDAMGPAGATTLVPKRKPARFDIPSLLVSPPVRDQGEHHGLYSRNRATCAPPPPVPWVTY